MAKKIETNEEKAARELVEDIATNIAQLSRSVKELLGGRLKKKSFVILLAHSAKLPQSMVEKVLDALESMETDHLKR